MSATSTVFDVDQRSFAVDVIERSRTTPVVVDFWAAWCGPCRTLGPMIEAEVARRGGDVLLAKLDVDANQALAQQFGVRGIPYVVAFRDGAPVSTFTGVIPVEQLRAFLDAVAPSLADRTVEAAAELDDDAAIALLGPALDAAPDHRGLALALAGRLVGPDPDRAVALATPHRPHPEAERVLARVELARSGGADLDALRAAATTGADPEAVPALARALAAQGRFGEAADVLLEAVRRGGDHREPAREQLVRLFDVVADPAVVGPWRRELARALF